MPTRTIGTATGELERRRRLTYTEAIGGVMVDELRNGATIDVDD